MRGRRRENYFALDSFSSDAGIFLRRISPLPPLRNIVKKQALQRAHFTAITPAKKTCLRPWFVSNMSTSLRFFEKHSKIFANIPQEEQPKHLGDISGACMEEMLLYAYQHLNVFKLILCHSEGTRFSKLIDEMVEIEIKGTHDYLTVLKSWAGRRRRLTNNWNMY